MNADTCTGDIHSSKNNKTKQNKTNKQKMSFTSDQLPNIAAVIPCGGRSSISSSNSSTTNQSINTSTGTMGISDVSYHENGQTLYVSPDNIYYQQVNDGNKITYKVVGK